MRWRWWILGLPVILLAGCTGFVARQIEHPGHHGFGESFERILEEQGLQRGALKTRGGVRIAFWLVPPRRYGVHQTLERTERQGRTASIRFHLTLGADDPAHLPLLPAKGSVLLLHPWGLSGDAMLPWGLKYAEAGYVALAPDLRSQGDSDDAPVGYGPREAADMVDLVQQLRSAGRLPGPLYVVGASYGATVALFAAPSLPQVRGVLAMEPYANAADTIRRAPASGLFGHAWLARWLTPDEVDAAISRAGRRLGLDLATIDAGEALRLGVACTVVVRGAEDRLLPAASLRALAARSPRASYVEVPGESHLSLPLGIDRLLQPSVEWMQHLSGQAGDACPGFAPLPLPAAPAASAKRANVPQDATASPAAGSRASGPAPTAAPAPAARAPAAA